MLSALPMYHNSTSSSATAFDMSSTTLASPVRHKIGVLLVPVSVAIWSTARIFSKSVLADVWAILFWRGIFSVLFIYGYLVWKQGIVIIGDVGALGLPEWSMAPVWAGLMLIDLPRLVTWVGGASLLPRYCGVSERIHGSWATPSMTKCWLRSRSYSAACSLVPRTGSTLAAQNLNSGILPNGSSLGLVSSLAAASTNAKGMKTTPGGT